MHVEKTTAQTSEPVREPIVHDSSFFATSLVRMRNRCPEIYGYITYCDPHVDYVRLETVVPTPIGTIVAAWAGTRAEVLSSWEAFIPRGDG